MSESQKEQLIAILDLKESIRTILDDIKYQSGLIAFKKNNIATYDYLMALSNIDNKDKIIKSIVKGLSLVEEKTIIQEFIGHIYFQLPRIGLKGGALYHPFLYQKAILETAFSIVNLLVDNEVIMTYTEPPKQITIDGVTKYTRRKWIYRPDVIPYREAKNENKPRKNVLIKGTTKRIKYTQFELDFLDAYNTHLLNTVRVKERHSSLGDIYFLILLNEELEAQSSRPYPISIANIVPRLEKVREDYNSMLGHSHHLNPWLDSRGRNYYGLTTCGVNPHGDSYEKHHWETIEPYILDERAVEILRIACVRVLTGEKLTDKQAIKKYKPEMIKELQKPLKQIFAHLKDKSKDDKLAFLKQFNINKKVYGNMVYQYELGVELMKSVGDESHYIHYKDVTNLGLLNFALQFKSPNCLLMVNLLKQNKVYDSHQINLDAIKFIDPSNNMTRKYFKDNASQGLNHGQRPEAIAENLGIKLPLFDKAMIESMGQEYVSPSIIADWFSKIKSNYVTWKTSDEFTARHTNYIKSMNLTIYGLDESEKGYTKTSIYQDMPLYKINGKVFLGNNDPKTEVKSYGGFANITHSIEYMRKLISIMVKANKPFLGIHDNNGSRLIDCDKVTKEVLGIFREQFKGENEYIRIMKDVGAKEGRDIPELVLPIKEAKSINKNAKNFLVE